MNSFLLNRQLGAIAPQAFARAQNERLSRALQADNTTTFASGNARPPVAHGSGVSSIAIDRFEGRYLVSGGADSSVAIWDLEGETTSTRLAPLSSVKKTSVTASLGITHISFYPFDSLAFITSGYDQTIKLFSSETLQVSAKFDLTSTVYSHAMSNVASHLLMASATQHPMVRLVDLKSNAMAQSLAGHSGSVLSVAWHPKDEYVLASSATDGTLRLWDIRRSASSLGVLDLEDSIGIAGYDGRGTGARRRERGRAHVGACNGVAWTDDGCYLVSTGLDERMRVWNMSTGANTLANFGPSLKNARNLAVLPLLAPGQLTQPGSEIIFFPNPNEILSFDLHNGDLLQRLRVVGQRDEPAVAAGGTRNMKSHTTSLAWRAHTIELYSAHTDGTIRCWRPHTWEDDVANQELQELNGEELDLETKKRKRDELDDIVRSIKGNKVTYS